MSFWTAIFLIVLVATLGRAYSARQRTLRRDKVAPDSGEAARLRAEVTRLNDRIKVLERLATDPAKRLSDEIDALKDK